MFELINETLNNPSVSEERRAVIAEFLDHFGVQALLTEFELNKYLTDNAYLEKAFEESSGSSPLPRCR